MQERSAPKQYPFVHIGVLIFPLAITPLIPEPPLRLCVFLIDFGLSAVRYPAIQLSGNRHIEYYTITYGCMEGFGAWHVLLLVTCPAWRDSALGMFLLLVTWTSVGNDFCYVQHRHSENKMYRALLFPLAAFRLPFLAFFLLVFSLSLAPKPSAYFHLRAVVACSVIHY